MKKKQNSKRTRPPAPVSVPKMKPECDPDCAFEDIFSEPLPINSASVDSNYIHERPGFLARIFRKKGPAHPKKVA